MENFAKIDTLPGETFQFYWNCIYQQKTAVKKISKKELYLI